MQSRFRLPLARLLVASSALVAIAPAHSADAEKWRLFVADHSEAVVRAVELDVEGPATSFPIEGPASLYRSRSGETVFALQGDVGKIHAIGTGIAFDDHGDHGDIEVTEPKLLPTVAEGVKPSHFVEHGWRIAMFYDGEGKARIVSETQFQDGGLKPAEIDTGAPHHGAAVTMGEHVVVSVPDKADPSKPPVGLRVTDISGTPVGEMEACPGFHGEAASGRLVAFGCEDAVLVAEPGAIGPTFQRLAYPADFPEGKVSTLKGGTALEFFLGNYGPSAVVLIERSAEQPFRLVELPTRRVDFAVDPAKPRQAYILTEDGQLHLLDVLSGKITKSVALTEPYSMDGHWRDPRPKLAVAGDHLAVTDPLKGLIRLVSTETLEEERTIPVPGTPYQIVAVGGSGEVH